MFLAVGNDPGNQNGASVIQVDQLGNLTFEFELEEQGCYDLLLDGDTLIVPGTDPYEGWELGNIYTKDDLGVWSKLRTLPNTIHALGACLHNTDLYVATGGHVGDQVTFRGYVLKSSDGGQTWGSIEVSTYRLYDIIAHNGVMYATAQESLGVRTFYYSMDDGDSWSIMNNVSPSLLTRMVIWQGNVVFPHNTSGIYGVFNITPVRFPEPPLSIVRQFNPFVVQEPYLYILCVSRIYRTLDLIQWDYYSDVPNDSTGLMSWPGFGLIVSTDGANAQLLRIPFV